MTETTAPQSAQPDCARHVYEAEQAPLAVHRSSKKPRGLDHLKEIQPPTEANAYAAQLRKVRYGPATLDAFLMPDGSFRFSMRVPVQGSGRLIANFGPVEPLTAA